MESIGTGRGNSFDQLFMLSSSLSELELELELELDDALEKAYNINMADYQLPFVDSWWNSINVSMTPHVNWESGSERRKLVSMADDEFGESSSTTLKGYTLLSQLLHPPPPETAHAHSQIRKRFPHQHGDGQKENIISDTQNRLQNVIQRLDVGDDDIGKELITDQNEPKTDEEPTITTGESESQRIEASPRGMKYLRSVNSEGIFLLINLILEILLVVLEQYSSSRKPHFSLMAAIVSLTVVFICIIELLDRGRKAKALVFKRQGIRMRCWFHPHTPSSMPKPLYSFLDMFSLICAVSQLIFSLVAYGFNRQHRDNPIKVSIVSVIFIVCMALSKCTNNRNVVPPPIQEQEALHV